MAPLAVRLFEVFCGDCCFNVVIHPARLGGDVVRQGTSRTGVIALEGQLDAPALFDLNAEVHFLLLVIHAGHRVKVIGDPRAGIAKLGISLAERGLVDAQNVPTEWRVAQPHPGPVQVQVEVAKAVPNLFGGYGVGSGDVYFAQGIARPWLHAYVQVDPGRDLVGGVGHDVHFRILKALGAQIVAHSGGLSIEKGVSS